ncbi:MAG: S41 family peptidase [Candidatus Limnocylindrales bacterium]
MSFHTDPAEGAGDSAPDALPAPLPDPMSPSWAEAPSAPAAAAAPDVSAGWTPATSSGATPEPSPGAAARAGRPRRGNGLPMLAVAIVAIVAGSTLFLSGWMLGRQTQLTPGTPVTEAQAWQPFWDSYEAVTQRYAGGPVNREALIQGAIKGMIAALGDPFSQYLTPEEFKQSLSGISGQFSGIGITVGTVDANGSNATCSPLSAKCRLAVESTIPGSPAERAGLLAGDVIVSIDGTSVDGMTIDQATAKIRGPKDTSLTLGIVRGATPPLSIAMVRADILTPEVSTKTLAGGSVGYIKLAGFSDQSSIDFAKAVLADVTAGRKALILDLRGNGGGFVTAARDIASQFLATGPVFYEQDASGNLTEVAAEPGGAATDPSIKLVVLVDGGTASASEIVTGALHDRGRATIIGTKTYGKGTVQQWIQLENDSGGFRLTVARWLTPDKVWINRVGITPDIVVTQQPTKPGDDPVLNAGLSALGFGVGGSGAPAGSGSGYVGS